MSFTQNVSVAVLLATHNGARYVWPQLRSLRDNVVGFTLHWLDDHSTDGTRDAVRACARHNRIALREYHPVDRLGVPGSFFSLLELVEADVYLFCDQDDIWQPGKIDSTVESLADHITSPSLSFTPTLEFEELKPGVFLDVMSGDNNKTLSEGIRRSAIYAFLPGGPSAQTQGFTRALRDLYLGHRDIARAYALMHDWWMYDIAVASGEVTKLDDAPRVLYRRHSNSFCASLLQKAKKQPLIGWQRNQLFRRLIARHARGLLRAADTLSPGDKLSRMLEYATLAASIDARQSLASAIRISQLGLKSMGSPFSMMVACMLTDADASFLEKEATVNGLLPARNTGRTSN